MKKLLGILIVAVVVAAVLELLARARHMFVMGLNPFMWIVFVAVSLLIMVPFLIKGFRWLKGRWGGDAKYIPAVLFLIACLSWLMAGGGFGWLNRETVDFLLHDTYYVIDHFHVMWVVVIFFGLMAGIYYLMSDLFFQKGFKIVAYVHFWASFIGCYIFLWPSRISPLAGMPRRYFDEGRVMWMYDEKSLMRVELLFVLGMQVVFLGVVVYGVGKRFRVMGT